MLILYDDDTKHNPYVEETKGVSISSTVGTASTFNKPPKQVAAQIGGLRCDLVIMDDLHNNEHQPPPGLMDMFKLKGMTATGRFTSCPKGIRMEMPMNRSNKPKSIGLPLINIDYSKVEDKVSAKLKVEDRLIETMRKRIENSMGLPFLMIQSKLHHEDSE